MVGDGGWRQPTVDVVTDGGWWMVRVEELETLADGRSQQGACEFPDGGAVASQSRQYSAQCRLCRLAVSAMDTRRYGGRRKYQ